VGITCEVNLIQGSANGFPEAIGSKSCVVTEKWLHPRISKMAI